jgi:hypothetical protein
VLLIYDTLQKREGKALKNRGQELLLDDNEDSTDNGVDKISNGLLKKYLKKEIVSLKHALDSNVL